MKKVILLIAFCLSLSVIYAQTIDVIHLKNGFDARGTITNRTESQITLQSENGRILTIDMSEIESMEQEQKAFDPRVLIGRWACYKANGERNSRYDMEINENEGFYTVKYKTMLNYVSYDNTVKSFPYQTPDNTADNDADIEVDNGKMSYYFYQVEWCKMNADSKWRQSISLIKYSCDINLTYIDGKLKGSIDILNYYHALGCEGYESVTSSLNDGCGRVYADGPSGKKNVYFVKY
jgi:hypothetical protein